MHHARPANISASPNACQRFSLAAKPSRSYNHSARTQNGSGFQGAPAWSSEPHASPLQLGFHLGLHRSPPLFSRSSAPTSQILRQFLAAVRHLAREDRFRRKRGYLDSRGVSGGGACSSTADSGSTSPLAWTPLVCFHRHTNRANPGSKETRIRNRRFLLPP